jgi:hypothetical protein
MMACDVTSTDGMVKVGFRDADGDVETLWATPCGPNQYRLENSPFFAYGVSWEDVVLAEPEADDSIPFFIRVVEKSGNRTIRLRVPEHVTAKSSRRIFDEIEALGCSYEGCEPQLVSVNLPPDVDLHVVVEWLQESDLEWEYADPTYGALFGHEQ